MFGFALLYSNKLNCCVPLHNRSCTCVFIAYVYPNYNAVSALTLQQQ